MTKIFETRSEDLKLHIFYAGNYYNNIYREYKLHSMLLRSNWFDSAMMTTLRMSRDHIITQEDVDLLTKGLNSIKHRPLYNHWFGLEPVPSGKFEVRNGENIEVCDDLEYFFKKIKNGNYSKNFEETRTYFLPQLKEDEMQLLDKKDETHLETYLRASPDIDQKEIQLSYSQYKYVKCSCERKTLLIDRNTEKWSSIEMDIMKEQSID